MAPSSTVENYLKAVHLGVSRLPAGDPAAADGPAGLGAAGWRLARPRPWSRRWPSRGWSNTSPTTACCLTEAGSRAGGDGAAPPPPGRAVPGAGDGHALGRGARRRRAPRARRVGSADRADGRDARPSRSRSARRPDSRPRRHLPRAPPRDAPQLPDRPARGGGAGHRSGRGVPALRRAPRTEARRGRRGRVARRGRRRGAAARPRRRGRHHRHPRRVEAAGRGAGCGLEPRC